MSHSVARWQKADNYAGPDFSDWYVLYARTRDSDCLTNANFQACCQGLGIDPDDDTKDTPTRKVIHSGHWLAGWIEWVGFHESDEEAMEIAREICHSLNEYSVLNEDLLSELEEKSGYASELID